MESLRSSDDLATRWFQGHATFRRVLSLAVAVGRGGQLTEAELVAMCRRCERYLLEVLPLETAIEERCLFPRLLGKRPDIDEALELARSHRRAQAPLIQALLAELEGVRCHPTSARHRQRLLVLAERLAFEFGKHLAYEERVLYPALGSLLTREEQRAVLREMGPPRALD